MPRDIEVNTSGFQLLSADFTAAAAEAIPEVRKVVDKGLLNIKQGMQRRWRGHRSIAGLPPAVSYDSRIVAGGVHGEVGPVVGRRQGSLGGIIEGGRLEYGNLRNAPIPAAKPEAELEAPRFAQALEDLAGDLLERDR